MLRSLPHATETPQTELVTFFGATPRPEAYHAPKLAPTQSARLLVE